MTKLLCRVFGHKATGRTPQVSIGGDLLSLRGCCRRCGVDLPTISLVGDGTGRFNIGTVYRVPPDMDTEEQT